MKTITVEQIFIKDMTGDKGPWKSYRVKEYGSDRWYGLKGWGKENVKQGDQITGQETSREWEGKTFYDITLAKPMGPEFEELEKRVKKLEGIVYGEKEEITEEDLNSIPF